MDRSGVLDRRRTPLLLLRLGVWSVLHAVFYFLQQLAELLAPLLLVAGLGWWALPRVVGAVTSGTAGTDGQAHDVLASISGAIPPACTWPATGSRRAG